ncbi:hypothetical protein FPE53_25400 [Salmonella enterica subsp. enterica]|uniref:Lysis protein for colicin n=1 Tax=Salmonella enterica subsp. enterica serovar Aqua TaxID=1302615 RepID=A0A5X6ES66_SALET|nr:hypothetical protein [Salmonella enterica subsp. enterica serovar Enteritidis]EBX7470052.1 hypothetical protein [Salmonella enterica subsp. enterica serovar Bareilly]ECA3795392.1 hypothetical protein [Salmonella enterica subsp. enterica serovar Aqua]EGN1931154.1 colicin release lysis protein [Salmonella enterica]HCM8928436.1 colicin release lysis protein [Salmonella enterica subsp. enterica serovar Paratyphi B]
MNKKIMLSILFLSMTLSACQVNNIKDTSGGTVAPSSSFELTGSSAK